MRSERAFESSRLRAATFGKNSAKRICATLPRVARSSDAHREPATTTDFAKPRNARQFWRVAGLARFSKRAELDYVLRSSEAVTMSGDPFRIVLRDRGACFFGSGSGFRHWWRKRKEPRRAWGCASRLVCPVWVGLVLSCFLHSLKPCRRGFWICRPCVCVRVSDTVKVCHLA